MGNSSSSANVFLSVNESRTCITAGSTISGEIRCPDHSISNDLFSGVTLYFIGKEDVEVRYTSSGHGTKGGGPKSKNAKRDIIRSIIPLDTSQNSVRAGYYPFQFHIPDQLPSSMYYKDGNGGYCSIRYKVKMHLLRGKDQEIPIEIMAKPPAAPIPSVAEPIPTRIQFCYCVPQGTVTWAAGVDDTRVGLGEVLTINLAMKNESLAKFERVTAKLKQTVEWHAPHHSSTNKAIIRSSSFGKTNSMKPWSKDQLRLMNSRKATGPAPLTVYEEVIETVKRGTNQVAFPIPEYVCQSYNGRLIKIQYYISIKAKTPSCFTDPKIHIPIEIVSPRHIPMVTVVRAVDPLPSAPPRLSHGSYLGASDVGRSGPSPCFASTLVVGARVSDSEEQYAVVDATPVMESNPSDVNEEIYTSDEREVTTRDTPHTPFDSRILEPLLARDALFDSGRM